MELFKAEFYDKEESRAEFQHCFDDRSFGFAGVDVANEVDFVKQLNLWVSIGGALTERRQCSRSR